MIKSIVLSLFVVIFESAQSDHPYPHEQARFHFPECPTGSEVIYSQQGFPQKCLPHQLRVCYQAANLSLSSGSTEGGSICCWNNKVDYYCCRGVAPENCPRYNDVTVVIRKGVPRPARERLYAFRKIVPLYRSPLAGQQFVARQPLAAGTESRRVIPPPLPYHRRLSHRSRSDPEYTEYRRILVPNRSDYWVQ